MNCCKLRQFHQLPSNHNFSIKYQYIVPLNLQFNAGNWSFLEINPALSTTYYFFSNLVVILLVIVSSHSNKQNMENNGSIYFMPVLFIYHGNPIILVFHFSLTTSAQNSFKSYNRSIPRIYILATSIFIRYVCFCNFVCYIVIYICMIVHPQYILDIHFRSKYIVMSNTYLRLHVQHGCAHWYTPNEISVITKLVHQNENDFQSKYFIFIAHRICFQELFVTIIYPMHDCTYH